MMMMDCYVFIYMSIKNDYYKLSSEEGCHDHAHAYTIVIKTSINIMQRHLSSSAHRNALFMYAHIITDFRA